MYSFFRLFASYAWNHDIRWISKFSRYLKYNLFFKYVYKKVNKPHVTISEVILEEKLLFLRDIMNTRNSKILEIGPATGVHSLFIDKYFKPTHLTIIERPGKEIEKKVSLWIDKIKCEHKIIYSDLLSANILKKGKFDVIFCLGIIYHNVEYFKIFNFFRRLINDDGYLVIGTVLSFDKKPSIIINYRKGQLSDFTRPSRKAIEIIGEMTGFNIIKFYNLPYPNQRGFFIFEPCKKPSIPKDFCDFGGSTV